jgi:hypothetical protein
MVQRAFEMIKPRRDGVAAASTQSGHSGRFAPEPLLPSRPVVHAISASGMDKAKIDFKGACRV